MIIVPNEWLIDWSVGYLAERRQVNEFLDLIEARRDLLVIRKRSPFVSKLTRSLHGSQPGTKRLWWLMLYDADKVRLLEEHEVIPLPETLTEVVPDDDQYLVGAALATMPSVLVTTDGRLYDILRGRTGVEVRLFQEFFEWLRRAAG